MVLYHETSGLILRAGRAARQFRSGDPVVLSFPYCGKCSACISGRPYACVHLPELLDGLRLGGTTPLCWDSRPVPRILGQGGFASHIVCSQNSVVRADDSINLRLQGLLGCGFQTGAGSVLNHLGPQQGRAIAIFGVGSVGLAALMAARSLRCRPIIAIDRFPFKLDLARRPGAGICLHTLETPDLAAAIQSACLSLDSAFDTTGDARLLDVLWRVLASGSRAIAIFGVGIGASLELDGAERRAGKSWTETTAGFAVPQDFIPEMASLHHQGCFPFECLVRFYPIAAISEAFADLESGRVIKPVLIME